MKIKNIKVLDIGHSNLTLESAQCLLETTVSQALYKEELRVLKVVTGHGSGKLRETIRHWCDEQEGRFQAVINGEDYHMFNNIAIDMRSECNIKRDMDFGRNNSAITYIWLW
tara:strand:- start:427 stop:762 length:336 start_codon:yes stop_codon:yes gene_type:complete